MGDAAVRHLAGVRLRKARETQRALCKAKGRLMSHNSDPPRTVHYVGFRDDRYWNALRVFGGPRMIHKAWDRRAQRDIGPDDVVIFAEGDETQPFSRWPGDDIDERCL